MKMWIIRVEIEGVYSYLVYDHDPHPAALEYWKAQGNVDVKSTYWDLIPDSGEK